MPGRQGRLLFAYLVAEDGRPVPREELAEVLWGDHPPATWEKALSVLVSKLRGLLAEQGVDGANALTGAFGCYRLELPEGTWVDVLAATSALQAAEDARALGDPESAKEAAAVAFSLVRQPFLPGDDGTWIEEKRRELGAIRTRALSVLTDAALHTGDPRDAAKWAEQLIALEPFREGGYRRLMEAHVAAGNRAEALRVYERCRRLLADELGAYPSPETESLYRRLLDAPALEAEAAPAATAARTNAPEPPPDASRRAPRRSRLWAIAVAAAGAAVAGAALVATHGGATRADALGNSIVQLDSSGSIAASVPVGAVPVALTSGAGSLWVANLDDRTVARVNATSRHVLRTISIPAAPSALAVTKSGVWVSDGAGDIARIDPSYDRLALSRRLASPSSGFYGTLAPRPLLAAFGSLWIVDPDGYVSRVNPSSARRTGSVDTGNDPAAIAAGAGSIWVANRSDGTVTRIDPASLLATTIPVGHGPDAIAVDAAGVWITNGGDNTVVRVDPETNAVANAIAVGDTPVAVLATAKALWVADAGDKAVLRLDPATGTVTRKVQLGGTPDALATRAGRVWVAVAPAPPPSPAAGGVAHVTLDSDLPSLDPALDLIPQFLYATCANLVTYPDEPAPEGSRIVPEVAEAVPLPTNHGRTYTFTIRPGFHFSPPSNEPVTAATFKSTIERVTNPRLRSPAATQFSGIVGYRAYVTGAAHRLSGIVARGRTLAITLTRPDGSFLANLASGSACAVPRSTPADPGGIDDVPSAGPYYIASYTPRQQLVLRRNPNYHGARPHRLGRIVFTIGIDASRALRKIEKGEADYALTGVPRDAGPRLEAEYGSRSRAAKAGHQQYFISEANGVRYLHMNTSRPLFSSTRLRRAVNFAIDRSALVAAARRYAEVNPFNAGTPTDDYLTPSIAGARDFRVYPLNGPDVSKAKRLAGHIHATAVMYTPNVPPWLQEAQIVRRDLKPLGIDVQVEEMPLGDFFARIQRRNEPFDLAVSGWGFGSTDPAQVLETFTGASSKAGAANLSHFHDAAFDREVEAAARLAGTRRYRAYNRLALRLERNLAPAAPFAINASRDFFSARIGCQVYQPVYGIDLAALCLRS